jgi:FtsP/CotA-like multicopper oxidase with cupredoxin domain
MRKLLRLTIGVAILTLAGAAPCAIEFNPFSFTNWCIGHDGSANAAIIISPAVLAHEQVTPQASCSPIPTTYAEPPVVGGNADTSVNLSIGYDPDTQRLCYVSTSLPEAPVVYVGVGHTLSMTINNTLQNTGSYNELNCPIDSYEGEGIYCLPVTLFQGEPGPDGPYYPIMANQAMQADGSSNLHVHGLFVSAKGCSDDVVRPTIYAANWGGPVTEVTNCQTAPNNFTYTYHLPKWHPAGLYWYHDHRHGFAEQETQMGLVGAIVVMDSGDVYRQSIGVSDQVLVVTDQPIRACLYGVSCDGRRQGRPPVIGQTMHKPRTAPLPAPPVAPADTTAPTTLDPRIDEVDGAGCAQGATDLTGGTELWTLKLNGAPVAEMAGGFPPDSEVLQATMQPNQRQIFRMVNGSADSFVVPELVLVQNGVTTVQPLQVWARDGVGIADANGTRQFSYVDVTQNPVVVPPAGRIEFVVHAPPVGAALYLQSQQFAPGCGGNQYPARRLLEITATGNPVQAGPPGDTDMLQNTPSLAGYYKQLGATADRTRTLVFSEYSRGFTYTHTNWLTGPPTVADYNQNLTDFFITQVANNSEKFDPDATTISPFDMNSRKPQITVHLKGRASVTEEWLIQNATLEAHAFHIHQVHFRDVTNDDTDDNLQPILDTIVVPPAQLVGTIDNATPGTPGYVKIRLTFSQKDVGEFMFHCHILEHEDSGMMGRISVVAN